MTKLSTRKSQLRFETDAEVYERGTRRAVMIEAEGFIAYVRLKGLKHKFPISWEDVYQTAAKREADRVRRDKAVNRPAYRVRGPG